MGITLDLIKIFTGAFLIALSGAVVPGPLLTLTVGRVIEEGVFAGPLIVFGHAISETAVLVGMVFGLGPFLQTPRVSVTIAVVGGSVLLWMGFEMLRSWRNSIVIDVEVAAAGNSLSYSGSVVTGIVGSISNPYWILWWTTVGAALISDSMRLGALGIAVFFAGHILADLLWYSIVAFSLSAGRKWLSGRVYQVLFLGCGIAMLGLGAYFIWSCVIGNNALGGLS